MNPTEGVNFLQTNYLSECITLDKFHRDFVGSEEPSIHVPRDHYPTLSSELAKMFFQYTSDLHGNLTPWDALIFTVYKLQKICLFQLREKEAKLTTKTFSESTSKIHFTHYLLALSNNNPELLHTKRLVALWTEQMVSKLENECRVHIIRLGRSNIKFIKQKKQEIQNSLFLIDLIKIFANESKEDAFLHGKLTDLQLACKNDSLSSLLEFCEFSRQCIVKAENGKPNDIGPNACLLLIISFLKKYVREGALSPLDDSQKNDLVNICIEGSLQKPDYYSTSENLATIFSPETLHLYDRCLEWFLNALPSHYLFNHDLQYQGLFFCLRKNIKGWKEGQRDLLCNSIILSDCYLSTLPGYELIMACRLYLKKIEELACKSSIEKFDLFLSDLTNLRFWADAVKELQPLIQLSKELFTEIPSLMRATSTDFLAWLSNESCEEKASLAAGYSYLMYNELLPVLTFSQAFKHLPHYFKILHPDEKSKSTLKPSINDFYEYLMHVLDPELVEALLQLSEDFFVEKIAAVEIEIPASAEKSTDLEVEEKSELETSVTKKVKKLSKADKNKIRKEKREEEMQPLLQRKAEQVPDDTKEAAAIPLSLKRDKLIKYVLQRFGGTCHFSGGHLVITTKNDNTVVIPAHGDTIAPGTMHAILKQLANLPKLG